MAKGSGASTGSGPGSIGGGINTDLYGYDPVSTAQGISARILGVPSPTLDINGERDERAVSEGNHGTQGGGRSGQGDPSRSPDTGTPAKDGGTGSVISSADSQ